MTDKDREAFEQTMIEEGRSSAIWQHPLHPGIYAVNETTRRFNSFKAGMAFARDHYAPKMTEKEAVASAVSVLDALHDEGTTIAHRRWAEEVFRAVGINFKEET